MRIKRFVFASVQEAMREIKASQGPNAVVLSTRDLPDGQVEIMTARERRAPEVPPGGVLTRAASAADASSQAKRLLQAARRNESQGQAKRASEATRPPSERRPAQRAWAPQPLRREQAPATPPAAPPAEGAVAATVRGLQADFGHLREALEMQLESLVRNDMTRRQPVRAAALREFSRMGVIAEVANRLVEELPETASEDAASVDPAKLLLRHLDLGETAPADLRGVIALVGATGAGKTTTLVKLAAQIAMKHGADQVALVSTDRDRVGGSARLARFAQLLGVPMYVTGSAEELKGVLGHLHEYRAVLVDNAGMAAADPALPEHLEMLRALQPALKAVLVLDACAHPQASDPIAVAYDSLAPVGCIVTKLDEMPGLGGVISVLVRLGLSLRFVTAGQRVPDDIEAPDPADLLQRTARLTPTLEAPMRADPSLRLVV